MGGEAVKITADTNLLARAAIGDDDSQTARASAELASADLVAITMPALCELVWVMSQGYKLSSKRISESIRGLLDTTNVILDIPATEAGLAQMEGGGDFADGVIAYQGNLLGGQVFVSFDERAVRLVNARGGQARLPTSLA
jgi:predicted nucleic-acid-binding protein